MKTIETERLLLRLFNPADAEKVAAICNNYNIYKCTLSLPYPYTADYAHSWIEKNIEKFDSEEAYNFAVTDKQSGELYGFVGVSHSFEHQNGEMGYWLGEAYWGKGFAAEAACAVIKFAFEEKNYHRVFARRFASNISSGKVMEKAGMSYEGTQRDQVCKLGVFEDVVFCGIINPKHQVDSRQTKE
jgi:RimJ/RimL family protein N-acetyltransferase